VQSGFVRLVEGDTVLKISKFAVQRLSRWPEQPTLPIVRLAEADLYLTDQTERYRRLAQAVSLAPSDRSPSV